MMVAFPQILISNQHFSTLYPQCWLLRIYPIFIKPSHQKSIVSDSDTVVLHIRGGDIYARNNNVYVHGGYVQNPLAFFERVMSKYRSAVVVAEPGWNPVTSYLTKKYGLRVFLSSPVGFLSANEFNEFCNLRSRNIRIGCCNV